MVPVARLKATISPTFCDSLMNCLLTLAAMPPLLVLVFLFKYSQIKKKLEKYFASSPLTTFDPLAAVDAQMTLEAVTSKILNILIYWLPLELVTPPQPFILKTLSLLLYAKSAVLVII